MGPADSLRLLSRGVSAQKAGRLGDACRHYEAAILADPGNAEARQLLGIALTAKGDRARAATVFRRAAELHPGIPSVHFNLGVQLQSQDQHLDAIASFARAVALDPRYSDAMYGMGFSYRKLGRLPEAAREYAKAAGMDHKWVPDLLDAGNELRAAGNLDEAVAAYRQCLAVLPNSAPVLNNLGIALQEQGLVAEAIAAFRQAIAADPLYAEAYNSLAPALQRLNRIDEAIDACLKAAEIDPSLGAAHTNLGNAYLALNDVPRALEAFSRAVRISPGESRFRANLCYAYLASGRLREAWPLYEERSLVDGSALMRKLDKPRWKGDADIRGRTLFVHAEQGFGDTIQFVRFSAVLSERGARVVVEVQPELKTLLGAIEGASVVIGKGDPMPPFDLHCPMLSLPLGLETDVDSIPCPAPYIRADPFKAALWDARFPAESARLRVGLVWSGQPRHKNDHNRSIPAILLRPLVANVRARFICLQNEIRQSDKAALADMPEIATACADLTSFSETAALIECMDLVVTVDTAVAHLAGAMGKPVWILLPFAADWRWMLAREDSPWYPTARLFRQPAVADWASVMSRVNDEIGRLAADALQESR
jgi:tetratricopeptide (TPR) repeat protein